MRALHRNQGRYFSPLLLLWLCAFCGIYAGNAQASPWPKFDGHVGPYAIQTPAEASDVSKVTFDLSLISNDPPSGPIGKALSKAGIDFIDAYPSGVLYKACGPHFRIFSGCSNAEQEQVLDTVRRHVQKAQKDPHMIGYWVLDDYPHGDVKPLLKKIHAIIAAENKKSDFPRPTICAFGGYLDARRTPNAPLTMRTDQFDLAVKNFDASACDMVALYPYGIDRANRAEDIDWAMKKILPYMLDALRKRGWNQTRAPLIGMPQAFGQRHPDVPKLFYPVPTAADVTRQSVAYCKLGAIALLAYAWNDSFKGSKTQMFNTPALVTGLRQGRQECERRFWH